jgi:BirA family biotin operon repressor/biotin-[acetyl-CoA-carboxylase] ligase
MTGPFDLTRFHELLQTETLGRDLIFEPSVPSTMDLARQAALHGAPEGLVALADEQTAGRGRLGRSWVSPPAVNLMPTMLLRPPTAILRQIPMIAPLAVCYAVEEAAGIIPDIKWPNDVQVEGKKLAGILIETSFEGEGNEAGFVLVGAGINVNIDPGTHDDLRLIATSLANELGHDLDREPLLAAYLLHFERLYEAAKAGVSPFDPWKRRLVTIGQRVRVTSPTGTLEGRVEGVDRDGALLLRTDTGRFEAIEAGDVTLR